MSYLRKKLQAIMACADFKGYLREVTGTDSVTLTDCIGSDMTSLSLVGNAVQNGTPSPETPVEVRGCGEKTANLFDLSLKHGGSWSSAVIDDSGWVTYDYTNSNDTTAYPALFTRANAEIKPDTTYTVITEIESISGCRFDPTSIRGASDIYQGQLQNSQNYYETAGTYVLSANSLSDLSGANCFLTTKLVVAANATAHIKFRLSVLEGSYTTDTMPPFEPYGYKVPVKVGGINLFDVAQITGTSGGYVQDGAIYVTGYPYQTDLTPEEFLAMTGLKEGDTFTTAADYEQVFQPPNPTSPGAQWITFAKKPSAPADLSNVRFGIKGVLKTITIPEGFNNDNYYGMYIYGGSGTTETGQVRAIYRNLRVYKGSYTTDTMPPYEPYHEPQEFAVYLPQQIAKVGDVADTVVVDMERRTAELRKNVGSTVVSNGLSSSSIGSKGDDMALFYKGFTNRFVASSETVSVMSDKLVGLSFSDYKSSSSEDMLSLAGNITNMVVFMKLSKTDIGGDTAESANSWIADNPITVYYVLATPTTTDISALQDWDAMPSTWRGTVVISADTTIQPSSMAAQYYATQKED